jgi:Family of unknown function (DUF6174)
MRSVIAMPRSRRWVWYFVALAFLGSVAVVVPFVYNLLAQLTPGQLAEARALWATHGPADYDLVYEERIGEGPVDRFLIQVRGGTVSHLFFLQGEQREEVKNLSRAKLESFTVPGLFQRIERHLDEDQGSRRNYATATFDRKDGHPLRYVHRVAGSHERLEFRAELLPASSQV